MVSPIMGTTYLTKVLMVGGSDLNILFASTLNKMGIPRSSLCPSKAPFYGIVLGKEAMPLGRVWLNITFGQPDNFRKEPLTFEVVDLPSVKHALLSRLCFAKFMAIPNYTYLKLKMPGPKGVITIEGSFEQPTTMRKIVSPKQPHSSPPALTTALATTQEGHRHRKRPRQLWCSNNRASARRSRPLAVAVAQLAPPSRRLAPPEGVDLIEMSSNLSP
jgi:hypothetical protein